MLWKSSSNPTIGSDLPRKVLTRLGDRFSLENENDQIDDEVDHDGSPQVKVRVRPMGGPHWVLNAAEGPRSCAIDQAQHCARRNSALGKGTFFQSTLEKKVLVGGRLKRGAASSWS